MTNFLKIFIILMSLCLLRFSMEKIFLKGTWLLASNYYYIDKGILILGKL